MRLWSSLPERMGLNPALVAEATRQLEGGTVHPMTGAAIEKEAAAMNDRSSGRKADRTGERLCGRSEDAIQLC